MGSTVLSESPSSHPRILDRRSTARLLALVLGISGPPVVIFVAPTLGFIAGNRISFTSYGVGVYMYVAAAVFLLLGIVAAALRRRGVFRHVLTAYLLSAPVWFVYIALRSALDTDGLLLPILSLVVWAAAVFGLRKRPHEHAFGDLAVVATLLAAISIALVLIAAPSSATPSRPADPPDARTEARPGRELPNIYHLVLDEFQTEMFEQVLTADLEHDLTDFAFFSNATTTFGRTEMSLASLFSSHDYRYDEPPATYIRSAYTAESSLTTRLERLGYRTAAYLHDDAIFDRAARHPPRPWGGSVPRTEATPFDATYFDTDAARVLSTADLRGLVVSVWLFTSLPEPLSRSLIPERHHRQLQDDTLLPDHAPAVSALSFQEFLRTEHERSATGRYTFLHLLVPHFPYVLDRRCAYDAGTTTDPLTQTRCAVELVRDLVETLKELDRYDDSILIVHGDHGARYSVEDGDLVDVQPRGFYSLAFSQARSRPLVLVKGRSPPEQPPRPLTTSTRPIRLEDLHATILDALGVWPAGSTERIPVFADEFPEARIRYYHFYAKDPRTVVDGPLRRFEVTADGVVDDRAIPIPSN